MTTQIKIALAQMRSEKGDLRGNLQRAEGYMVRASEQGCHIIIYPEAALSGYCDPVKFPHSVLTLDSPKVAEFVELTRKYDIAASMGILEENPGHKPFVTQVLAQEGHIVGTYRKMQIVDEDADFYSAGSETPVFGLYLPYGEVTCGLAICADSDRRDIFKAEAEKGAQIVFHSSAPGLYGRRITEAEWKAGYDWYRGFLADSLPGYARENGIYIAVATQAGQTVDEDFPGGSFVFGPDGSLLAATEDWSEALLVHTVEVQEVR